MAPSATDILPEASRASNKDLTLSKQTSHYVDLWSKHVAVESAQDHIITDVDGKKYIDFISQFAVMNFGYSHPKIAKAAAEQIQKMPLVGTAYISPLGSEAVESAVKIARKWAYTKKGISEGEAWILTTDQCYHGLTLATMPLATVVAKNFGQHVPNVGPYAPTSGKLIQYGDVEVLEETFKQDGHKVAAFLVEAVQGWAGTRFPPKGYLKAVQDLCNKYNILFICDEIQSGYGRTGRDLAYQHEEGVHPDLVTLGKAVTGGFYPMSVIMGKKDVMDVLGKNEVLSTFGAAPVACAAAIASLEVLEEEKISERSQRLGELLSKTVKKLSPPHVKELRGGALFQSLVLDESVPGVTARRVAALAALRGVLVGIGAGRLRFSPPITITEEDLVKAIEIVVQALKDVTTLGDFPGSDFLN
ncbi:uncharacterized protein NECHADRAFT_76480 [Fusarium vanettenii 77-13-4]|uniref:Ornithine aminotransferase n=1 Tax=Fusarium vanettenii (strain ATCC MYA-4622 / CBS 123669 / FGSC 9596 / NRRL 45880 / 77-13-4) TaxID=660122 RepID=C7Z7M7_FUSV7|nr:uncharacterized protein NECHADRAFT_76480 [Fusarium vanettenii 77-13-4]EEU40328.1 hypothetical protein NECHADRAFT_76480 [Fusarium vanettenii 77-13-4]